MAKFEVNGRQYVSRKMKATTQFHVARKLMPAVLPFVGAAQPLIVAYLEAQASGQATPNLTAMLADLEPMLKVLSSLPAEDCDFVIETCLGVVDRADEKGGGWSPVWNASVKAMMFDDIDMVAMLTIAGHVIKDNLANFMAALPRSSSGVPR